VVVDHLGLRHTASITPVLARAPGGVPQQMQLWPIRLRPSGGRSAGCARPLSCPAQAGAEKFPGCARQPSRRGTPTPGVRASPGAPPHACFVSTFLIGERTGRLEVTTPGRILADRASSETIRIMARLLGGGDTGRTPVAPSASPPCSVCWRGWARQRWHATGKPLVPGVERDFHAPGAERAPPADMPPNLPPNSAIILGEAGPWYVDGATGAVGRVRLLQPPTRQNQPVGVVPAARPTARCPQARDRKVQPSSTSSPRASRPGTSPRVPRALVRQQRSPRKAPSRTGRCHRGRSRHPATPAHPRATPASGRMPG